MNSLSIHWTRSALLTGATLTLGALAFVSLMPRPSHAIPAYARRYDVECATCHSPLPPRLNNVGMVFRRSGLRLPDADANGKLELKTVEAKGIGDAMSISAELNAQHLQADQNQPGAYNTSLKMGEVALVAGSSVGEHFSTQVILIPRSEENTVEFEEAEVQANFGRPDRQMYVKGGQTEILTWEKANEGVITLSAPLAFDEAPVAPVGGFAGFALGVKQTLIEAGFVQTSLKNGRMMSTILTASALTGVNAVDGSAADTNPTNGTDYLLQATELIGDRNTIGAFYYNGRSAAVPDTTARFNRLGAVGSYSPIDRLELAGGIVRGEDKSEEFDNKTIKSLGGYIEANVEIRPHWIGVYRFDQADPNTDVGGDLVRAHVLSTTAQIQNNLFLTAEYREQLTGDTKPHDIIARVRFVF